MAERLLDQRKRPAMPMIVPATSARTPQDRADPAGADFSALEESQSAERESSPRGISVGHSFGQIPIYAPEPARATHNVPAPDQASAPVTMGMAIQREPAADREGAMAAHTDTRIGPEGGTVSAPIAGHIQASRGNGVPLDDTTRARMEPLYGHDFSRVRVHADAKADVMNRTFGAHAFTIGNDIYFRQDRYDPASSSGHGLLAHELTHVVQQQHTLDASGPLTVGAADDIHEQEASEVARQITAGEPASGLGMDGIEPVPAGHTPLARAWIQRDGDPNAAPTNAQATSATADSATQASPDAPQEASLFEGDAAAFFETNMRVDLRSNIAIEGAAIARHASYIVGDKVRAVCEPYERDQEIDTETLNLVFAVVGGGASVTEAGSSGSKGSPTKGANVGSRIFRMGLGIMNAVTPKLAGYRTVGSLKDAAIREMTQQAASAGETTAPGYVEYEQAVMTALEADWQDMIDNSSQLIRRDAHPEVARRIAEGMLPTQLTTYQNKVRTDYGSQSTYIGLMETNIAQSFDPKMDILRGKLEEAKLHRQHVQEAEAIGGGIAGGAAIGAGLGLLGGPFAPITVTAGAIGGAVIGGVIGAVGAAHIAGWF